MTERLAYEDHRGFVSPREQAANDLDLLIRLRDRYMRRLEACGGLDLLTRLLVIEREIGEQAHMPPSIEKYLQLSCGITRTKIDALAFAARESRYWDLAKNS